ncbi:MAG TPA: hypothetical protein VF748_12255 [Candidatus Acidoferrum sp.]
MPQISDDEYNHLMGRKKVADFVEPIYNSKELGNEARALIKKAYPNLQIEGFDLKQELQNEIASVRNEFQETERKRKDTEETEKFQKTRKKVQDDYRFTEEGMKKLEDLMVERNIGDYEAGALLMASKEPKTSEPTAGSQRFWNYQKQDSFEEISKDPEKWGFNQLVDAANRDAQRARNQGF